MKRQVTEYTLRSPKLTRPVTLALVTDLHNGPWEDSADAMRGCDAILIGGDMPDRHHPGLDHALSFFDFAAETAPVFYACGNHEWRSGTWERLRKEAEARGIRVLDNNWVRFGELTVGGFSSAPKREIDTGFPARFAAQDGFRLLLCHHPEWYRRYICGLPIDLTLSGHAHGGQIEVLGRGLYAPGQGILPRYTAGWYFDRHLLVGRGMTNSCDMPRWGNPTELIRLTLMPEK